MNQPLPQPADQRALRSIALQFWLNGTLLAAFIPRLPELRDQLGINIEQLGQAITLAMLGGILGSMTVDWACRQFDLKKLMVIAAASMMLALVGIAYSTNVWMFSIMLAAFTLLDVWVDVAMNIQGSQLSERAHKPVMNRLHGLWSIGTVCGSLSAATAISLGWSLQLQLLGLAMVAAVLLTYVATGLKQALNSTRQTFDDATSSTRPRWEGMLIFTVLGAAAITPELVSSDWSAFRIRDDLAQPNQYASFGFVIFGTGMMLGRLGGDEVVHRYGQKPTLHIACVVAFIGITLAAVIDHVYVVFFGLVLAGLGVSVFFPAIYDNAAKASRKSGAALLGAMTAGARIAALGLPISVGVIATWHSVGMAFAILALPAIVIVAGLSKWIKEIPNK